MTAVLALARRVWGTRPPARFDDWFDRHVELLVAAVTEAQRQAVADADDYVADVLDELGTPVAPDARIVTEPLVGIASDGRKLDSLMYGAVITTKNGVGSGLTVEDAWDLGMKALLLRVQTQVADAARSAVGLGIAARPRVGYVRMLNPPSCSRCVVLAGKFYGYNRGFRRHPGCDCRHIPTREDSGDDLRTDPRGYFDSLSAEHQDKAFTKAGAQAIRDGADISQVVNARRGMSTAQVYGHELAVSTEGVTRRGIAYDAMRRAGYARRDTDVRRGRYFQAKAPRLMPEAIYEIAEDRADALRLLRLYGYLDDMPVQRPRPVAADGRGRTGRASAAPSSGSAGTPPPVPPTARAAAHGGDEDDPQRWPDPSITGLTDDEIDARVQGLSFPDYSAGPPRALHLYGDDGVDFTHVAAHVLYGRQTQKVRKKRKPGGHKNGIMADRKTWFPRAMTDQDVLDTIASVLDEPQFYLPLAPQIPGNDRRVVAKLISGNLYVVQWFPSIDGRLVFGAAYPDGGPDIYRWTADPDDQGRHVRPAPIDWDAFRSKGFREV